MTAWGEVGLLGMERVQCQLPGLRGSWVTSSAVQVTVASLSFRQAASSGGGGGLEGWGETSVSRKGVRIREALGLSVQGQAWISGGQKSIIPGILELGSEPVWSPSPIAKLQLTSSPCSQGLYTPPWKLSGQ